MAKKKLLDLAKSLAKRHGSGFKRTQKQWESSIADHIGNFVDRITIEHLLEILGFAGLFYTYYQWEKDDRPLEEVVAWALPQASIDYLLLKSRTDAGVAVVVGHLGGRGLIELFQSLFP